MDNGKATLTLHHLNKHFSQLNPDAADNSYTKIKHIGQKGLHINPKGKDRLLDFVHFTNKIRSLWWSSENLNIPTKLYIFSNNSLNNKNTFNLRTSEIPN